MKRPAESRPVPAPLWELERSDGRSAVWRLRDPLVPSVAPRVEASALGVRVTGAVWDWLDLFGVAQLRAVLHHAELAHRLFVEVDRGRC